MQKSFALHNFLFYSSSMNFNPNRKVTDMTVDFKDFSSFFEAGKDAWAPMVRFNQKAATQVERLARLNYEVAGDYLGLALQQLKLASDPEQAKELPSKQVELLQQFGSTLSDRMHEYLSLSTEAQKEFDSLVQEASLVAQSAPKARKKAA